MAAIDINTITYPSLEAPARFQSLFSQDAPSDSPSRAELEQSSGSQAQPTGPERPKGGFEAYVESRIARRRGRRVGPGGVSGRSVGEVYDRAYDEYGRLSDDDKKTWEDRAQMKGVRSDRERSASPVSTATNAEQTEPASSGMPAISKPAVRTVVPPQLPAPRPVSPAPLPDVASRSASLAGAPGVVGPVEIQEGTTRARTDASGTSQGPAIARPTGPVAPKMPAMPSAVDIASGMIPASTPATASTYSQSSPLQFNPTADASSTVPSSPATASTTARQAGIQEGDKVAAQMFGGLNEPVLPKLAKAGASVGRAMGAAATTAGKSIVNMHQGGLLRR